MSKCHHPHRWHAVLLLALLSCVAITTGPACNNLDDVSEVEFIEEVCAPEVCDGIDNDCDQIIDEDNAQGDAPSLLSNCTAPDGAAAQSCARGRCQWACTDGRVDVDGDLLADTSNGCECMLSGDEVCDGVDNDCDGTTDEDDPETDVAVLSNCTAPTNATAERCLAGGQCQYICEAGFVDVDGDLNLSTQEPNGCECALSGNEVCDGVDNDCDGMTDEDDPEADVAVLSNCAALNNATVEGCMEGQCQYVCEAGFVDVDGDLNLSTQGPNGCECTLSGDEVCDGVDNDCDGMTDEDEEGNLLRVPCARSAMGVCTGAQALCTGTALANCSTEELEAHAMERWAQPFEDTQETLCDEDLNGIAVDNDCDGMANEVCCTQVDAFVQVTPTIRTVASVCSPSGTARGMVGVTCTKASTCVQHTSRQSWSVGRSGMH
ncbi:MAG: MopE-related protein [Myxococcota bacterium]